MTIANINIGTSPNDGTGDTLRHGFQIVNNNFAYIDSIIGVGNITPTSITTNLITANNATITNLTTTTGTFTGLTAGNVTATSNVSAVGAVMSGPVFGSGFFYSNGTAVSAASAGTGNVTFSGSTINGAAEGAGLNAVLKLAPNITQIANGQYLTLDATTYPNIYVNSGDPTIATLIIGQSNHGVILSDTTSAGNITINPYKRGITANATVTITGNVLLTGGGASGANISSNFNLIGILGTQYLQTGNITDANTATTVTVAMQPVFSRTRIVTANANVALDFNDSSFPVVRGTERVVYIRNTSAGNITVSNVPPYNNKGTTSTTISSGTVSRFVFLATDNTFGNIIATVTNN